MAQDNKNYDIVQLSESEWGVQYVNGPLISGFSDRQVALDYAYDAAQAPEIDAPVQNETDPRNLDEAMIVAQARRDDYRNFIGENPTASEEQKDAMIAAIAAADAYVSEYQYQMEIARREADSLADTAFLDYEIMITNAERQRDARAREAIALRLNPQSTPVEIRQAEEAAFDAELYYQSLLKELDSKIAEIYDNTPNSLSLYSGGTRSYVSFGGQVNTINTDLNAGLDGVLDVIRNTLNPDFGSITRNGLGDATRATGYGTTQYSGSTVYDTSVGVTKVSDGADQRVKLRPKPSQQSAMFNGILEPLKEAGGLVFPYTPQITMRGSTNYNTLSTVHANQDWHIYQNTPSIDLTIQGLFTAQNEVEARYMLAALHFLRVCTKMHFGSDDANRGLPPPQVLLDGYGPYMFNGLSVIIKDYDMELNNNVDYVSVQAGNGESKLPAVTTISVNLTVQQTPKKAREFNWDSFASGELMQKKGWL